MIPKVKEDAMSDEQPKPHPAVVREPYEPPTVRNLTVTEAREMVLSKRDDGVMCPVCDQHVKVYKRALRGALAVSLIHMYRFFKRNPGVEWLVDTPRFLRSVGANATNDVALLRHWRLIEPKLGEREDGSPRIGVFRLTPEGRAFVLGVLKVPRFALLYNQALLGLAGELVSIKDALGDDFNYAELMAA
jgi:hypothetical protein